MYNGMQVYLHTFRRAYYAHVYVFVHICVCAYMCMCVHVYVYVCACVCICVCVCVHMCVCAHAHKDPITMQAQRCEEHTWRCCSQYPLVLQLQLIPGRGSPPLKHLRSERDRFLWNPTCTPGCHSTLNRRWCKERRNRTGSRRTEEWACHHQSPDLRWSVGSYSQSKGPSSECARLVERARCSRFRYHQLYNLDRQQNLEGSYLKFFLLRPCNLPHR